MATKSCSGTLRPQIARKLREIFPSSARQVISEMDLTAYHEAGHAVVAAVLGHAFDYCTIIPEAPEPESSKVRTGHMVGLWYPQRWNHSHDHESDVLYLECAVIGVAGVEAESRVSGQRRRLGRGSETADGDIVDGILNALQTPVSDSARKRLVRECRERAGAILEQYWFAVEATSAALFQQEQVGYADVLAIVRPASRIRPAE